MTSKTIPPEVAAALKAAGQRLTIPRAPRDADDVIVLLKAWRDYDLEQAQVAELTGVTRKMLWYWAAGTTTSGRRWPVLCSKMEKAGIPIADREKVDHTRMRMHQPEPPAAGEIPALAPVAQPAPTALVPIPAAQIVGASSAHLARPRVEDDGTLVFMVETRIRPGDPGYAEALRRAVPPRCSRTGPTSR
jgi:hypothetical protein